MSEIDQILRILGEHYASGDTAQNAYDLASERPGFASGGTFDDKYNVKPIDPSYNDIVVSGDRNDWMNDLYYKDILNRLYRENMANASNEARDTSSPDEIVVTAPRITPPPTWSDFITFQPLPDAESVPPSEAPGNTEDEIVVVARTPTPTQSFTSSFSVTAPSLTEVIETPPLVTPEPTATIYTTTPPMTFTSESGGVPGTGTTTRPTVTMAATPALTWNPNLIPAPGPVSFPAEYTPLQPINLPNYANIYDTLFQGQGANSPLGQSMLVPPDQMGGRLDAAMAAAQQAQQPQEQSSQQTNTGSGKARGGSVNDTIDGIIEYLQSIRR